MHSTASLAADMLAAEEGRRRVTVDRHRHRRRRLLADRPMRSLAVRVHGRPARMGGGGRGGLCAGARLWRARDPHVRRAQRPGARAARRDLEHAARPAGVQAGRRRRHRQGRARSHDARARSASSSAPRWTTSGPEPLWLMVFHADAPDEAAELADAARRRGARGALRDPPAEPDVRRAHRARGRSDSQRCRGREARHRTDRGRRVPR